jgi:uracil-DNA glycosylase
MEAMTANLRSMNLNSSWRERLKGELDSPYFAQLSDFVSREYASETVYPAPDNIFRAFDLCPFDEVRAVVLGQDPYHGPGQANGLCFAVEKDVKLPPSLRNIFKEIESDLGKPLVHKSGDLTRWAEQGVLLLNATLTVRASTPSSHQKRGWEKFTDAAVRALSEQRDNLVFMLWGAYAKAKGAHIDRARHCVLEAGHPSPLSVRSFLGCRHFSKANAYLTEHGKPAIDWL